MESRSQGVAVCQSTLKLLVGLEKKRVQLKKDRGERDRAKRNGMGSGICCCMEYGQ
jgi:hypothetical protein